MKTWCRGFVSIVARAVFVLVTAAGVSAAASAIELPTADCVRWLVREDMSAPVRPGDPLKGVPFWNRFSTHFMYPPAFDFALSSPGYTARFTIVDENHRVTHLDAPNGYSSLSPVWETLPPGRVTVICDAIDWQGRETDRVGERTFVKIAPFTGRYPKAARSYAEAAKLIFGYLAALDNVNYIYRKGEPDPNYGLNSYPSKMHAYNIRTMLEYAKLVPAKREFALKVARAEADHLISLMEPADAALPHFTPTYDAKRVLNGRDGSAALRYSGQSMNIYPAQAAHSFVRLYRETKDRKYLEAAEKIAGTFLRLQLPCGTWYVKQWMKDAKPVDPNLMIAVDVMQMMEDLYAETGDRKYRASTDRAERWIMENPVKTWNWEGHFEDCPPVEPYRDLTKHTALNFLLYVCHRHPGEAKYAKLARELLRYAEDQFVRWEPPCRRDDPEFDRKWAWTPVALEQYFCYEPIDASSDKLIRAYLEMYRAEGKILDLLKAKALADTLTRCQEADGRVPTFMYATFGRDGDWMNCMGATAMALMNISEFQPICDACDRLAGEGVACLVPAETRVTKDGRPLKPVWEGDTLAFSKMLPVGEEYEAKGEVAFDVPHDGEYLLTLDADWRLWVDFGGREIFAMPDGWRTPCEHRRFLTLKKGRCAFAFRFGAGSLGASAKFRLEPLFVPVDAKPDPSAVVPVDAWN